MRPFHIILLASSLGAAGCNSSAYDITFLPAGGDVTGKVALLTIEVKPIDESAAQAGQSGENLCLLATVSQGSIGCVGASCSSADMGRRITLTVPTITPRMCYLQYNAPDMVATEILGVSLYPAFDCTNLNSLDPLLNRAIVLNVKP